MLGQATAPPDAGAVADQVVNDITTPLLDAMLGVIPVLIPVMLTLWAISFVLGRLGFFSWGASIARELDSSRWYDAQGDVRSSKDIPPSFTKIKRLQEAGDIDDEYAAFLREDRRDYNAHRREVALDRQANG